jgi:hypothetical protein
VEKVSVTLRIPTELKAWADEFALHSHIDLSGLFIQSLRETQQRGALRIAPLGYRNDVVSKSDFSPESWKNLYNSIAELELKESLAEII